jgi:hypothetical protein
MSGKKSVHIIAGGTIAHIDANFDLAGKTGGYV